MTQRSFYAAAATCDEAVLRIRAAIRTGRSDDSKIMDDLNTIQALMQPLFVGQARRVAHLSPTAKEDLLDEMAFQLVRDICSLTFVSLEGRFGVYVTQMARRKVQELVRNHAAEETFFTVESMDTSAREDGLNAHELVEDSGVAASFEALAEREALDEAIRQLPEPDRQVFLLRASDVENREIAQRLGVSPPTATRIYQRAVAALRAMLRSAEE